MEADLSAVNGKFLQLHGPAGGAELDLYGRAATVQPTQSTTGDVSRSESFTNPRSAPQTGRIRSAASPLHCACALRREPERKYLPLTAT